VYADVQSSLTGIAQDYPDAADAIRVVSFNVEAKAPIGFRTDAHGTAGRRGQILQHKTASFSIELYATGGGATGTAPDWHNLLTAGGWVANSPPSDTTVSGGSSTTTRIDVASSSGWEVGDALVVENQIRRVTAVDSVATDLVVSPALSAAPAASAAVAAAYIYNPDDNRADSQGSLTLWGYDNRRCDRLTGAVITSITVTASGSDELRMSIEGQAYRSDVIHSVLLNGSINASVTTITVDSGLCVPSDVSSTAPVYMQIESEVVKVIGVSGNDLTVDTRGVYLTGGAAATHADNVEIYPYEPTATYVSAEPISRTAGSLIVNAVDLQHGSASLTCDMGVRFTEASHGSAYALDHYTINRREVTFQASGASEFSTMGIRALEAANRTEVDGFLQAGATGGSIVAWECPKLVFENPSVARARDEELVYDLSGPAHENTGEDDVYIMVG
jgi:hypothetical protein